MLMPSYMSHGIPTVMSLYSGSMVASSVTLGLNQQRLLPLSGHLHVVPALLGQSTSFYEKVINKSQLSQYQSE